MFAFRNLARREPPKLPYEDIKNTVLGKEYDLSLVFIGSKRSQFLNRTNRGKDKPANVLSFPLSKTEGELFLDRNYAHDYDSALLLFIHGLFHLKGLQHGRIMDEREANVAKSYSRDRRGNIRNTGGGY